MKTSVVWNPTRLCVWNCDYCCLNAIYTGGVKKRNTARDHKYSYRTELNFTQRLEVVKQLSEGNFRLDFGGGEFLAEPLNLELVEYAAELLGKENLGISTSGVFINDEIADFLKGKIQDIEISLDCAPERNFPYRPDGYHLASSLALKTLKKYDHYVGAQTVLTKRNIDKSCLDELYEWLVKNGIDKWSILRFFPAGRGERFNEIVPNYSEYVEAVKYLQTLDNSRLNIHYQYLLPSHPGYTLKCRAVKKSVGILPDGTVTSCFWSLGKAMNPKDIFVLGKLPQDHICDLMKSSKAKGWLESERECSIFER